VETFNDIPRFIATNLGTPVTLELERAGKPITLTLIPRPYEDDDGLGNKIMRPLIGFKSKQITYKDVGVPMAVWEATRRTYEICATSLEAVGQIVTGKRGTDDLRGPLGIAKLSGQATDKGLYTILWFVAMLSANLGLINLFPVPLLDGGHLLYYAIEGSRGRPLAVRMQELGFRLGAVLIATLMAFTLYNDIKRLF
jgi:regulator of sigma E protease